MFNLGYSDHGDTAAGEYVHPPSHFKRLQLKHRNYGHTDSSQANSTKFWRDNLEEVTTSQISKPIAVKEIRS